MNLHRLHDVNIVSRALLPPPARIARSLPLAVTLKERVYGYRRAIRAILDRHDPRLLAVVGPCSIHDTRAALEYARRLKALSDAVRDTLFVVMRVYFEKPRTTVGWKGLINDPFMDDSFHIEKGLRLARQYLIDLTRLGLPAGTEALDPITPQYIGDLISWTAIGARTTESQTHREMASGLSTPVGFKNGTDGASRSPSTPSAPPANPIISWESPRTDAARCFIRGAIATGTSSCAAAAGRTTTPAAWPAARRN